MLETEENKSGLLCCFRTGLNSNKVVPKKSKGFARNSGKGKEIIEEMESELESAEDIDDEESEEESDSYYYPTLTGENEFFPMPSFPSENGPKLNLKINAKAKSGVSTGIGSNITGLKLG